MPINNVGFRAWTGPLQSLLWRWLNIAEIGIAIALKSRWLRRLLLVSWLPVLYIGTAFFMFEKYMEARERPTTFSQFVDRVPIDEAEREELRRQLEEMERQMDEVDGAAGEVADLMEMFPGSQMVVQSLMGNDLRAARHAMWCWMLMNFFRYPQGVLMLILIGLIVPPLISRDLRSRAYLMYFSRPIGRFDYLLGKLAIPATFLVLITTLPAMALYVFGVLLSPGFHVVADAWDIPFRIIVASAVLIVPTSILALMFSSLTHESRFAAFAWFATWGLGAGAYIAVSAVQFESRIGVDGTQPEFFDTRWSFLSIFNMVGRLQEWVFGLQPDFSQVLPLVIILGSITLIALMILYSRVAAPLRA